VRAQQEILSDIYKRLYKEFGPQHWWPATDGPFEVCIGAILTQNTAWTNVEKAILNLKKKKLLSPSALKKTSIRSLSALIKPSGYYNQKAKKLKNFINFLYDNYDGSLDKMFETDFLILRSQLLSINGIGLETADSILLYAGNKPIFVIDAYTKRILSRHGIVGEDATYSEVQNYFMDNLQNRVKLFNEYHALLVSLGKDICRKSNPKCTRCPLRGIEKGIEHFCDSCSKELPNPNNRYKLEVKLYCCPDIKITEKDLKKDLREDINSLINQMKHMDKKKLEEDVFVSYNLDLCKRCRDTFNTRLKHREFV